MDRIRESVKNPMAPDAWWKEGDDPWQLLATCMEYVKAVDAPDPTAYLSNIPVHQVMTVCESHRIGWFVQRSAALRGAGTGREGRRAGESRAIAEARRCVHGSVADR